MTKLPPAPCSEVGTKMWKLHEFDNRAEDLLRRDIRDARKSLAAFFGVVKNVAPRTRDSTTDDVALILVTPFVPVVPGEEEVNDVGAAQRRKMARARIIADKDGAERKQCIE